MSRATDEELMAFALGYYDGRSAQQSDRGYYPSDPLRLIYNSGFGVGCNAYALENQDEQEPPDLGWTEELRARASAEGWDIFENSDSAHGVWQIQHFDDPVPDYGQGELNSDEDAWLLVRSQQTEAQRVALAIIKQLNPEEWSRIMEYQP